jgi:hypothetical protein
MKVRNVGEITLTCNNCPSGVLSMSTWGLFIGMVTCCHYNVYNVPVHLPQSVTVQSRGHYGPLAFTIIFEPVNGDATCVHCLAAAGMGTSSILVTFGTVHCHLEASGAEMTFGAIFHRPEGSPLHSARSQLRLG